jgi:hypothetical protein
MLNERVRDDPSETRIMFTLPLTDTRAAMLVHGQTIGFLLNYLKDFKAISVHVERIAALQQAYSRLVPEELIRTSRVGYQSGGIVVLTADNGAAAAKLRLFAPRVSAGLKRGHPGVSGVRVEVSIPRRLGPAARQPRRIGRTGTESLRQLAASLPPGPLQVAVRRLLKREERSNRNDDLLDREKGEHDPHDR